MKWEKTWRIGACALMLSTMLMNQMPIAKANEKGTKETFITTFKDVKGHWAEEELYQAYQRGMMKGTSDTTMKPNDPITRAEYVAMLSRITKQQPNEILENPFSDAQQDWYAEDVKKLVSLGFVDANDYANGFKPDAKLTRGEMVKWMITGLAKSNETFAQALTDTKDTLLPVAETYKGGISSEIIPYVALTLGTGVVGGFEDHTIRLKDTTTRAEVASILLKYANVEGQKADNYKALSELREVGKTGSNVLTMTPYTYINKHDFSYLRDKPIKFSNGKGEYKVKRIIFVDLDRLEGSGIYAPMFIDEKELLRQYSMIGGNFEEIKGKGYRVFIEMAITSHMDNMDGRTFLNGLTNTGIECSSSIDGDNTKLKAFNYPTYPTYWNSLKGNSPKKFFKKGVEKVLWMDGSLVKEKMKGCAYKVRTASGEQVGVELKK